MEENPRLGLDEKELLKVITKYLKDTHPIVSLKGNPNSASTSQGGAYGDLF
jgi:hypothetical protein